MTNPSCACLWKQLRRKPDAPRLWQGQLASATVRQFEFWVNTVDNVALKRSRERTGNIMQWLMMFPAGAAADAQPMRDETTQQIENGWEEDSCQWAG